MINKHLFSTFIIFCMFALIFPIATLGYSPESDNFKQDDIKLLSKGNLKELLNETQRYLSSRVTQNFAELYTSKEQAAMVVVLELIKLDVGRYKINKLSKVMAEIYLGQLANSLNILGIEEIATIQKLISGAKNSKEAINLLVDWLQKKEIEIGVGTLEGSLPPYDPNNKKRISYTIYYTLAYHAQDGKLTVIFDQKEFSEVPSAKSGIFWGGPDLGEDFELRPFRIKSSLIVNRKKLGFFGLIMRLFWGPSYGYTLCNSSECISEESTVVEFNPYFDSPLKISPATKDTSPKLPETLSEKSSSEESSSLWQKIKNVFSGLAESVKNIFTKSSQQTASLVKTGQVVEQTEEEKDSESDEEETYSDFVFDIWGNDDNNFSIQYLDSIWQLEENQKLKHKNLDCEAVFNTDIWSQMGVRFCNPTTTGCNTIEDKVISLDNQEFRQWIRITGDGNDILVEYSFTYVDHNKSIGLQANVKDYKQCMSDFEEVLKTLELNQQQPEQKEAIIKERQGEKKPETQSASYQAEPLPNGINIENLSIALTKIERTDCAEAKKDYLSLGFTLRIIKESDKKEKFDPEFSVEVVDDHNHSYGDHGNRYGASDFTRHCYLSRRIGPGIGEGEMPTVTTFKISDAPIGFTWYKEICPIRIPSNAPLTKLVLYYEGNFAKPLSLGQKRPSRKELSTIDLTTYKPKQITDFYSQLKSEYFISLPYEISRNKYTSLVINEIKEGEKMYHQAGEESKTDLIIPITIKNSDYSPTDYSIGPVGIQHLDGSMAWGQKDGLILPSRKVVLKVDELSEKIIDVHFPYDAQVLIFMSKRYNSSLDDSISPFLLKVPSKFKKETVKDWWEKDGAIWFSETEGLKTNRTDVLKTFDSGQTWDSILTLNNMPGLSWWLVDELKIINKQKIIVFARGSFNQAIETEDGGKTWELVSYHGRYYGSRCVKLRTQDGGKTWQEVE